MTKKELEILESKGWLELNGYSTNDELKELAFKLGQVVKHPNGQEIYTLKPKDGMNSGKGTFSNKYGFGKFPLHTDTAFYAHPIRFMILNSSKESNCHTTIVPIKKVLELLNEEEMHKISRAIYIVKTNENRFFTSLIFNELGIQGFKYDPSCMFPYNKKAKEAETKLRELLSKVKPIEIKWTKNKTVIIDNWRTLHGRSTAKSEENRELKRIYIN